MEVQITLKIVRISDASGMVQWKLGSAEGLELLRAVALHDSLTGHFMGYRVAVDRQIVYFQHLQQISNVLEAALTRIKWLGEQNLPLAVAAEIRKGLEEGTFSKWLTT